MNDTVKRKKEIVSKIRHHLSNKPRTYATEVSMSCWSYGTRAPIADFVSLDLLDRTVSEYEIKISWSDYKKDWEKPKHEEYQQGVRSKSLYVPDKFYFATDDLKLAERIKGDLRERKSPYGLFYTGGEWKRTYYSDEYNYGKYEGAKVMKYAKKLLDRNWLVVKNQAKQSELDATFYMRLAYSNKFPY